MIRPPPLHIFPVALLLAVLTSVTGACDLSPSCVDIGCPQNLICDNNTGECSAPLRFDCTQPDTPCPVGELCDPTTGQCLPQGASCQQESCPTGQTCNLSTGFCEALLGCQVDPCTSPAEICDQVTDRCVPLPCQRDLDCGSAYYCSDQGECLDGCRPDQQTCPQGQFCQIFPGDRIGQCTEACANDADCPIGQRCVPNNTGAACVPQPCETDRDCRLTAVCRSRVCVPPPCLTSSNCPEDQFCDSSTGECLGGACEDDINSPNHAFDTARAVTNSQLSDAIHCAGRDDWYAFELLGSDTLRVRMEHSEDADLDLYLYDQDLQLIGLNETVAPTSRVDVISTTDQIIRVEVRGSTPNTTQYDISFERNPDLQCRPDIDEDNDQRSEAVELDATSDQRNILSLTICGPDEDWFVLSDLEPSLGLFIEQRDADSHIETQLLTPDGQVLPLGDLQQLRLLRLGFPGDYYLRIRSSERRSNSVRLRVDAEVTPPLSCRAAGEHSSPDSATRQPPGPPAVYSLCPQENGWEVDWIALEPPPEPAMLYLQLNASTGLPPLEVDLLSLSDQVLSPIRTASSGPPLELRAPILPDDQFLLRVGAPGPPGRIIEQPDYQLFYRFEALPSD